MKILLKYKFRTLLMAGILASLGVACDDREDLVTVSPGASTTLANTNTYMQIETPVVSFQGGTSSYDIEIAIVVGHNPLSKLNLYKTFNNAASAGGGSSNEALLASYDVSAATGTKAVVASSITYDDLRSGLTIGGSALPTSDFDLAVGASWDIRLEGVGTNGVVYDYSGTITVAVLSPYAGIYKVYESAYYRIGVESGASPWNGVTRFIGSIDDDTFSHAYVGPLFTTTYGVSPWAFDVDFDTNVITAPASPDEPLIGDYSVNCVDNPGLFTNVPCAGSNVLIPDLVNGKHVIKLTYGYWIDDPDPGTGGVREFYEFMERVVD